MISLTPEQKKHRLRLLEISYKRKLSHLGSCLTAIDLIDAIYKVKKRDEKFILSNGHAGLALYVVLEKHGYLKNNEIHNLFVHPDRNKDLGIDASTGSLGQGLPIALGIALANRKNKVYCMVSDGECNEGSIWESLRLVSELKLNNLIIVINFNGWSAYDKVRKNPLIDKFKAFGLEVVEINGHKIEQIAKKLKILPKQKPLLLFAKTNVEQFPFLKGLDAHYYTMNNKDFNLAKRMLK